MTDDKLEEMFGEEKAQQMKQKIAGEDGNDDPISQLSEVQVRLLSVLEHLNRAKIDTEYVLAKMDADKFGSQFEYLEDVYEVLGQVESEVNTDEYLEITERDYDVDGSIDDLKPDDVGDMW